MIRVRQIEVGIDDGKEKLWENCAKKLKINKSQIKELKINKKSIDAREKNNICYSYEVDVSVENEDKILKKIKSKDSLKAPVEGYKFNITGTEKMKHRPVIVGSGPAGLFTAYMLAKYGYHPLVLERGEKVEDRVKAVETFWEEGKLNLNSNVQFGEGGAGTFSDGKLNTLVKDKEFRNKKVLEIFVEAGAPKEILYINKPHIGTDKLRIVVKNLRDKIISMGGEIRYNACVTNIEIENKQVKAIQINNKERLDSDVVVLAIGHSARDTFRMLNKNNVPMEPKPFAVGLRVQHNQDMIDYSQYGEFKDKLSPASYKLTFHASNGRGVYSFCMCPGGYVVNASSEGGRLAINGMSNFKRDSKCANSAIVVTVEPKDFESKLFGGLEFQESLEEKTYNLAGGKIPVQLLEDFIKNQKSERFKSVIPEFKGECEFANLQEILPEFLTESIKEAFPNFDKKIKGFANGDTVLSAIETRTSSPIRIIRNKQGESQIQGLYPAGEGAGYAGGIMSAAMDGLKTAENIAKKYLQKLS